MTIHYPEIRAGMPVIGSDVEQVGHVQEVHENEFVLNRPRRGDLLVPLDAVHHVTDQGWVVLTVSSGRVDEMGWLMR